MTQHSTSGNLSKETQNTNSKEHKHPLFTEILFTITNVWKQPKCPSVDEWIEQLWYIYTMEYYSAIKRRKYYPLCQHEWTWEYYVKRNKPIRKIQELNDFIDMLHLINKLN